MQCYNCKDTKVTFKLIKPEYTHWSMYCTKCSSSLVGFIPKPLEAIWVPAFGKYTGGKTIVTEVEVERENGTIWVRIENEPTAKWLYMWLFEQQDKYKEKYGNNAPVLSSVPTWSSGLK